MSEALEFMYEGLDEIAEQAVEEGFDAYHAGDLSDEEEPLMAGMPPGERVENFIYAQWRSADEVIGKWERVSHNPERNLRYFMIQVRRHIKKKETRDE